MVDFTHLPVMVDRIVELFQPVGGVVIDATLGGAGHSRALLDGRADRTIVGLDADADAIAAARIVLAPYEDRATLHHVRFDQLGDIASAMPEGGVMGVLFDLGVSSPQLDRAERGFSFRRPGPLDMRMDRRRSRTARDIVNDSSSEALASMLRRYADERYARRIAEAIVAARPLETTDQLAEVVANAIPAPARRRSTGHPARRTFQALRIEVNDELGVLADAIDHAVDALLPGGRLVAMSYHSGEDRLVKERFRMAVTGGCECPPLLPCGCGAVPVASYVTRGAERASAEEIEANPRAESVRVRAISKLDLADRQAS